MSRVFLGRQVVDAHVLAEEHLGKFARQLVIIPAEYRVRDSRSLSLRGRAGNSRVNSTLSAIAYRAIVSEIFRKLFLGFAVKVGGKRGERSLNDEAVMGKTRGRRMGEFERAGYDF